MTNIGGDGIGLWDEEDEFYYDVVHLPGGERIPLRLRSLVGLIPLFAVEVLDASSIYTTAEIQRPMRIGFSSTVRTSHNWCRVGMTQVPASGICCRCCAVTA